LHFRPGAGEQLESTPIRTDHRQSRRDRTVVVQRHLRTYHSTNSDETVGLSIQLHPKLHLCSRAAPSTTLKGKSVRRPSCFASSLKEKRCCSIVVVTNRGD
uniref:Ovule protein n=1 Tax=Nippostrongylus brasiliensis TaxID=27835 RepID=A0A0N4XSA3_NIPBR